MAFQSIWYYTNLDPRIVNIIEEDLSKTYDSSLAESLIKHKNTSILDKNVRNSHHTWIPTNHWISGFIWHYAHKANKENFLYELDHIDTSLQYTIYQQNQFYKWHTDQSTDKFYKPLPSNTDENLKENFLNQNTESVRKLSGVLQLSDPNDYECGELQIMAEDGSSYFAPKEQGTIIFFDSRSNHRVRKVTKGIRKSLVFWVKGPRWK